MHGRRACPASAWGAIPCGLRSMVKRKEWRIQYRETPVAISRRRLITDSLFDIRLIPRGPRLALRSSSLKIALI
jgi:hypothetical protein